MSARKVSAAQRKLLDLLAEGGAGAMDFIAEGIADRTLRACERAGLVVPPSCFGEGWHLTDAGRAAQTGAAS